MGFLILGVMALLITAGLFVYCLPRDGKLHRFVDTEFEPYVAVVIVTGVALSFALGLSGVIALMGGR